MLFSSSAINSLISSFDNEFKRVVIHGALHLVGYNDIEDKDKLMMKNMENKYLEEFNFTISS